MPLQGHVGSVLDVKSSEDGTRILTNGADGTARIWDAATGKPCHNAIVWQDRRTSEFCDELKTQGYAAAIQEKTGFTILSPRRI